MSRCAIVVSTSDRPPIERVQAALAATACAAPSSPPPPPPPATLAELAARLPAEAAGFRRARLPGNILRFETAGAVGVAFARALLERGAR